MRKKRSVVMGSVGLPDGRPSIFDGNTTVRIGRGSISATCTCDERILCFESMLNGCGLNRRDL